MSVILSMMYARVLLMLYVMSVSSAAAQTVQNILGSGVETPTWTISLIPMDIAIYVANGHVAVSIVQAAKGTDMMISLYAGDAVYCKFATCVKPSSFAMTQRVHNML